MTIEYKTEGKLNLKNSSPADDAAVVTWLKGGGSVTIFQGSSGRVTLDKAMLIQLAESAESVADDLQPNMGSLPRPA